MLVDLEKIQRAKEKLGRKNADIIAELFHVEKWDDRNHKGLCPFHSEDTPSFIYNPRSYKCKCFRGDTMVITKQGTVPIESLAGKTAEIINGVGEWEKTKFYYCGDQQIYELHISSRGKRSVIYTTKDHEWVVQKHKKKITTDNLKTGYRLEKMWAKRPCNLTPSEDGMRHGFIYGDGAFGRRNKDGTTVYRAVVYDENKYNFCKQYFQKILPPPKSAQNCLGQVEMYTTIDCKKVPSLDMDENYLYGFLVGLFVADGNCSDETAILSSSKIDDLVLIKNICTILGMPTYQISSQKRTFENNMGVVTTMKNGISWMHTLRIAKSEIPENFFFGSKRMGSPNKYKTYLGSTVVKVVSTDEIAPVYCCETSTHSFVLENFVLTGNCFGCGKVVDVLDAYVESGKTYMEAVQSLFEEAEIPYAFGELGVRTKPQYRYPREEPINDKKNVYAYLAKRHITQKVVDGADVREDDRGNIVFNYYDTNDVLCLVKYRPSHKIDKSKGEIKNWCQKDADTTPLLFNMNRVNVDAPLLICEGEIDCLAAIEAGWSNAVSVPFGANNYAWIEENFEWLEQFDSIIICADNDDAGTKMQKECVFRLGSWRTKFIEIPENMFYKTGKYNYQGYILKKTATRSQ